MAETRDLEATATEEPEVPAGTEADEEPIEAPIVETQGRKLVDVSVVASERKRAREKGERAVREKEVAPLQAKAQRADQLEAALAAAKPYIDLVRQHPEWLKPAEPSGPESAVPEAEAAQEARELELYDVTGALDVARARRIIARRRTEASAAARQAAEQVVAPLQAGTAQAASRQNFVAMAQLSDAAGQPYVDPKTLAEMWAQFPPEPPQHPGVARVLLGGGIGRHRRTIPRDRSRPTSSEAPGGRD